MLNPRESPKIIVEAAIQKAISDQSSPFICTSSFEVDRSLSHGYGF